MISQRQLIGNDRLVSFYQYDGHGSVRGLTDSNGNLTDQYDYDAYGLLINSSGNTPNNYFYAGEQFDHDLNLYYNRARYLDVNRGRFWSQDSFEGFNDNPLSLHKYLYGNGNPVNNVDPSGLRTRTETTIASIGFQILQGITTFGLFALSLGRSDFLISGLYNSEIETNKEPEPVPEPLPDPLPSTKDEKDKECSYYNSFGTPTKVKETVETHVIPKHGYKNKSDENIGIWDEELSNLEGMETVLDFALLEVFFTGKRWRYDPNSRPLPSCVLTVDFFRVSRGVGFASVYDRTLKKKVHQRTHRYRIYANPNPPYNLRTMYPVK